MADLTQVALGRVDQLLHTASAMADRTVQSNEVAIYFFEVQQHYSDDKKTLESFMDIMHKLKGERYG